MNKFVWIFLSLLSGAFLPIQAGMNTQLGKSIANPVYASMISFIIGAIAVAAFVAVTHQPVSWAGLRTVPLYAWWGGILGAFYVTAIILSFPRIGPALTFGLVVAGQMIVSIVLDHFNIMVANQHPVSFLRLCGIGLVVVGVILIRKF